jgi:hypothetical protein
MVEGALSFDVLLKGGHQNVNELEHLGTIGLFRVGLWWVCEPIVSSHSPRNKQ